jgi:hypothetical protein
MHCWRQWRGRGGYGPSGANNVQRPSGEPGAADAAPARPAARRRPIGVPAHRHMIAYSALCCGAIGIEPAALYEGWASPAARSRCVYLHPYVSGGGLVEAAQPGRGWPSVGLVSLSLAPSLTQVWLFFVRWQGSNLRQTVISSHAHGVGRKQGVPRARRRGWPTSRRPGSRGRRHCPRRTTSVQDACDTSQVAAYR